jgi:cytochrome c5
VQKTSFSGNERPLRLVRAWIAPFAACAFLVCAAAPAAAGSSHDGAVLFQKHCLSCHTRPIATGTFESLLRDTRTPPVGMPAFGEEKLTDDEVLAIAEHLFPEAREQDAHSAPKDGRIQARAEAANVGPEDAGTARSAPQESSEAPRRTLKQRKAWLRGFGTN